MKFASKAELTAWARDSRQLWLFLDYDGTLADFAPTPEIVELDPSVNRILEQLLHLPAIRVTVLSGRRLGHVRFLLPLTGIFLAGTYGVELSTPENGMIQRVQYAEIRPALETIKPQWARILRGHNNFFLEDKGWTLALHARYAEDEEAERVLADARTVIEPFANDSRFRILGGHKFLEIVPRLASKREAVTYLLTQYPLPEARLLYIGDDDKDEDAFPVIHANQGIAIKVRQLSQQAQPTTADFFFESPTETLQWLDELIQQRNS